MASTARIDELKKKFDENPRRYFAPLANEFRKAGEIEQAIMICEEFLPQQPGHMSGHIVYGQALYEAGRLPESRTVFETALALDPENLIALRHLGDIAHSQGDDENARTWYLRVLDADPRNEEIQALIGQLSGAVETPAAAPSAEEDSFARLMDDPSPAMAEEATPPPLPAIEDTPRPERERVSPSLELDDTQPQGIPSIPVPSPEARVSLGYGTIDLDAPLPAEEITDEHPLIATGEFTPGQFVEIDEPPAPAAEAHEDEPVTRVFRPPQLSMATEPANTVSGGHELPPLDIDEGTTTPAHGDVLDLGAPSYSAANTIEEFEPIDDVESPEDVTPASDDFAALEFETLEPVPVETAATVDDEEYAPADAQATALPDLDEMDSIPAELPPAVIAAEAELTDEFESPAAAIAPAAPFVTETMAELYLAQGFRSEALAVYEQLADARPDDTRLAGIVANLSAPAAPIQDEGPSVRDVFARLASRRPGARVAASEPPSDDDFADAPAPASEPIEETAARDDTTPLYVAPIEQKVEATEASAPPGGSIDALFGNREGNRSEDSAAAALAQAFGGSAEEEPMISGRPAREATAELSLDSVFRDAPARAQRVSQNFSFDQFFAGGSVGADRSNTPAPQRASTDTSASDVPTGERGPDDIEQFNSWLQGLKSR